MSTIKKRSIFITAIALLLLFFSFKLFDKKFEDSRILSYEVAVKKGNLRFYLKDEQGENYGSIANLKSGLKENGKELTFAMNGGMYTKAQLPLGLYIEDGKVISPINRMKDAHGNFYMQPNGVLYITKNKEATVCTTADFEMDKNIEFATQSGPMLVIDGEINAKFGFNSKNKHIRNGVGLLPNGNLLFAISKETINFYDFASFFKQNGCKNALYLDGFVSRAYIPSENWLQTDGSFGVIIAESN